jgi:hypothetical protein
VPGVEQAYLAIVRVFWVGVRLVRLAWPTTRDLGGQQSPVNPPLDLVAHLDICGMRVWMLGLQLARQGAPSNKSTANSAASALDAANVRRAFRRVVKAAGLDPTAWTPRELRQSFVSLLSSSGLRIEDIADLCGHDGTAVTEKVYRHQLRPVLLDGAIAMDQIFETASGQDA